MTSPINSRPTWVLLLGPTRWQLKVSIQLNRIVTAPWILPRAPTTSINAGPNGTTTRSRVKANAEISPRRI